MIGYLRGTIFEKSPNQLILDANGVGYDVQIPISTYTAIGDLGKSASLRIHTHVREDALQLYGFATTEEKALFERLISVSGIGPKLAITVLSGLPAGELLQAIRTSDLQRWSGFLALARRPPNALCWNFADKVATHRSGRESFAGRNAWTSVVEPRTRRAFGVGEPRLQSGGSGRSHPQSQNEANRRRIRTSVSPRPWQW